MNKELLENCNFTGMDYIRSSNDDQFIYSLPPTRSQVSFKHVRREDIPLLEATKSALVLSTLLPVMIALYVVEYGLFKKEFKH